MTGYNRNNQLVPENILYVKFLNRNFDLRRIKFFDVRKEEVVEGDRDANSYYILKITKYSLFRIDKMYLDKYEGTIHNDSHRKVLVKADSLSRGELRKFVNSVDFDSRYFRSESLFSDVDDYVTGLSSVLEAVRLIGKIKNVTTKSAYAVKMLVSNLASLIIKMIGIVKEKIIDLSDFVDSCISFYNVVASISELKDSWKGESLTILIPILSCFMPKNLLELIKRINLFSNSKFLDDPTIFYTFFHTIMEYISSVLEYLPSWLTLPASIKNVFASMLSVTDYVLLSEIDSLYKRWRSDPKCVLEDEFRVNVKSVDSKITNSMYLQDWGRRSPSIAMKLSNFKKLSKCISGYEKSSRTEPVCIVIEGPPGNKKSILMNSIIEILNMSSYSHITKPIVAGKDFYDSYNNEEIFYMDDVGQMGTSQWNNIINFVSPVKLPLDCAAVELKDTKFFSSDVLLLTTNKFSNIQGVSAQDGIGDLKALWRRGLVFDFKNVISQGNWIEGTCFVKHFCVKADKWVYDFPQDLSEFLASHVDLPREFDVSNKELFLAWSCDVIKASNRLKRTQNVDNKLTSTTINSVRSLMSYNSESWATAKTYFNSSLEYVRSALEEFKDVLINLITSFISLFQELIVDISIECKLIMLGVLSVMFMIVTFIKNYGNQAPSLGSFVKETSEELQIKEKIKSLCQPYVSLHSKVKLIQEQTFEAEFLFREHSAKVVVLWSGSCLITVGHVSSDEDVSQVTLYKSREDSHKMLDHTIVKRVYYSRDFDISIWRLPTTFCRPYKDLKDIFLGSNSGDMFIHPHGVVSLFKILAPSVDVPTTYNIRGKYDCVIQPSDFFYHLREDGLCGSVITDLVGNVAGFHVAGNVNNNTGVALRLDSITVSEIYQTLDENVGTNFGVTVSNRTIPGFSGIKLTNNFNKHTPKKTNFINSPFHGIFPISRIPANLTINGNHTVKDVEKKSFAQVVDVDFDELNFGKMVLSDLLPKYSDITMQEVINGDLYLSPLNKKSSNGHGLAESKDYYIDYEKGSLKPAFARDYELFLSSIDSDTVDLNKVLWTTTLKDELRDVSKKLPRSFRVSTLFVQLLTKSIFGGLTLKLMQSRADNGILIGINPFSGEWESIEKQLLKHNKFWAGDIKNWDGSMLPQAQHYTNDILLERYKGKFKKRAQFILTNMAFTPVAVNDDTYITNHSMPSGSFLTAMYNSLINRFYTAMWYYRNMKVFPKYLSPFKFNDTIIDYVYGDDKLNVLKSDKFVDQLNALTMKSFFQSVGMDFTTSTKGVIETPFQELKEITLLKRTFEYHPILRQIVGPLDLKTIFSSISWIDKNKDFGQVMHDKLHVFQREIFLHVHHYQDSIDILSKKCKEINYPLVLLSEKYLCDLYGSGEYGKDIMDSYLFREEGLNTKNENCCQDFHVNSTVIREPTASVDILIDRTTGLRQSGMFNPFTRKGITQFKSCNKTNFNFRVEAVYSLITAKVCISGRFNPEAAPVKPGDQNVAARESAYDSTLVTRDMTTTPVVYDKFIKLRHIPMDLRMDYSRFHNKPIFVGNIDWSMGQPSGADIAQNIKFPHGAFANKALTAPFDFSALYRMKACFLLQVVGTPMHQGCVIASVYPTKLARPTGTSRTLASSLQSPHAFLHANQSTPVCVEIPYYSAQPLKPSFVSVAGAHDAENNADYATLYITTLQPLLAPVGATTPLRISVHVIIQDSEFFIPTNFDTLYTTESVELKSIGKYSSLLNNGLKVVTGDLIDAATSKFYALTGFHDPTDSTINVRNIPTAVANLHNVDQEQKLVRLDPHSQHFKMYDDYYFCTDKDEMLISNIVEKPAHLGNAKVTTADSSGTLLFSHPIFPRTSYSTALTLNSPMDILTTNSRCWRGGLKLHIMAHMSNMHTVKLFVAKSYAPPSDATSAYPAMADVLNYQSASLEFSAGGQVQTVELPYCSNLEQLYCVSDLNTIALQHGIVYVYVQTPLMANATVIDSVNFSFFLSAGEDFQYFGYSTDPIVGWASEAAVPSNVATDAELLVHKNPPVARIVDSSFIPNVSIRDYLRRLTPMYSGDLIAGPASNQCILLPIATIFQDPTHSRTASSGLYRLFYAMRGGLRFRIKVATVATTIVTTAETYITYIPPGCFFDGSFVASSNPLNNTLTDIRFMQPGNAGDCIKIRPQYRDTLNCAVFEFEVPDMSPYSFRTTRNFNRNPVPLTGLMDATEAWGHFLISTGNSGSQDATFRVTIEVGISDETRLGFQVSGSNSIYSTNAAKTFYTTYFNRGTTAPPVTFPVGKSYIYRKT